MSSSSSKSAALLASQANCSTAQSVAGLADLLARVEEAAGPDRELDTAIWLQFTPGATRKISHVKHAHSDAEWDIDETRAPGGHLITVPSYTASLDAALALVERAGGGKLMVENLGEMRSAGDMTGHWLAQLGPRGPRRRMAGAITAENLRSVLDGFDCVSAPTPALALLAALLKALASQQPRDQQVASDRSRETPLLNTSEVDEKR